MEVRTKSQFDIYIFYIEMTECSKARARNGKLVGSLTLTSSILTSFYVKFTCADPVWGFHWISDSLPHDKG